MLDSIDRLIACDDEVCELLEDEDGLELDLDEDDLLKLELVEHGTDYVMINDARRGYYAHFQVQHGEADSLHDSGMLKIEAASRSLAFSKAYEIVEEEYPEADGWLTPYIDVDEEYVLRVSGAPGPFLLTYEGI